MDPAALILVYISFWSIAAVGGYLVVVGLGNLRYHRMASPPPAPRGPLFPLRRLLFQFWDVFLLTLGALMAGSAMLFLYTVVYG